MDRRRRRRQNLVSLQPNFRLSILLFLIIAHCHSSHQLEDDPEDAGGQPRFISLSAGSKIYGELLISLPLSIILPTLAIRRSVMVPSNEDVDIDDDESPPTSASESTLMNVTTTMDRIFLTLGIGDELDCQKRFICETMREPKKFEPISNIIYLLLRDSKPGLDVRSRNKYSLENFIHYREAFVAGQLGSSTSSSTTTTTTSCIAMYPNCSIEGSAARSIDFPILRYWQKLSDLVPLTITV